MNILFVCLGNICRSAAAEGVMKALVEKEGLSDKIFIDSAGTYGGHEGEPTDPRMKASARTRGYNLTSISRKIRLDDFEKFDMIVVMDDNNYESVCRVAPTKESINKIHRMTDFCVNVKADHVPDPYYEGREGFEIVIDLLEDACKGLLNKIK